MATANSPSTSDPSADTGDFFSIFNNVLNQGSALLRDVGSTANAVTPLWDQKNPNPVANNNAPTFAGNSNTTGTVTGQKTNYLPWIIGGGVALLLVVFVAMKK